MTDAPPSSVEHERELLGALLVNGSGLVLCQEVGLVAEHFYLDKHRALYRAVVRAATDGTPGDELAAWAAVERLGFTGQIERSDLSDLAAQVSTFRIRTHALRLVELAGRRAKLDAARLIGQGAVEPDDDRSGELITEGMALLAQDFTVEAEATSRAELASLVVDYFDSDEAEDLFKLPFEDLNHGVLGGLRRGDVTVFGGHTNMGKSWLLDQSLAGFAEQGFHCAIFATEMPKLQRVLRFITSQTGISLERLMTKKGLSQRDYSKIVEAAPRIPFDYYECHGWSADRIAERILSSRVDVAAVDTVNKIPGLEKSEIASRAATRFASVAARGNLHLILVSQVNRNRVRDLRGVLPKPMRHDLRDTAALETHAAQILFIHRDQDDDANVKPTGEVYWDKVRNGMKAAVKVEQSSRHLRFVEQDDSPAQQQIVVGKETNHDVSLAA